MNLQLYAVKKNFDQQKAERFFKERRIPLQVMDMKKHKLGRRELELFLRALGAEQLLDREDKRVKEHPACYYNQESLILDAILENPWLMRSPILRNGQQITVGYCPEVWTAWIEKDAQA